MSSIARFRRTVVTAEETDSIIGVARRMRDEKIGCVVVIREGLPVGILTDRDVALRVVAEGREPAKTRVSDVLTYGPAKSVVVIDTYQTFLDNPDWLAEWMEDIVHPNALGSAAWWAAMKAGYDALP